VPSELASHCNWRTKEKSGVYVWCVRAGGRTGGRALPVQGGLLQHHYKYAATTTTTTTTTVASDNEK